MSRVCIGLDLSLRSPGIVALPAEWEPGDWSTIFAATMKELKGISGAKRLHMIGEWCRDKIFDGYLARFDPTKERVPPFVSVEQHAFAMSGGAYALERAELVGVVKERVWREFRVETIPIVASSARKHLFGAQRRMNRKEWKEFIEAEISRMGCETMTEDERDAFVIANRARYLADMASLSCA